MITAFALALSGFSALALSMDRHQRDIFGRRLDGTLSRWFRRVGWVVLTMSPIPCIAQDSWGIGLVGWLGALTLAAGAVVLAILVASASGILIRPADGKGAPG